MINILFLLSSLIQPGFAFETCNINNDYLEATLPPVTAPTVVSDFPQRCVEAAHLSLPLSGYYGYCPTAVGKPSRTHRRPCVSEKYVSEVHTMLLDVADCLDYDARLAFANFTLESGMHLNAVGAATDVGVGQLTRTAIDEINLNAFDRALRMMKASPKSSCQKLIPFMTRAASDINNRCSLMTLPENPARNLIYSILLLQQNRRVINNLWSRLQIELPAAVNVERLKTLMQMLAYNAGPAGITTTLKAYVDQMGSALSEDHFTFEGKRADSFKRYLKENFPGDPVTRKRVSTYVGHIMASTRKIDRSAGGSQACVHQEYLFPPVRPFVSTIAPDSNVAKRLVEANLVRLAQSFASENSLRATTELGCSRVRHDFEFAFLGRGQRVQDLPVALQQTYSSLCH